MSVAHGLPFSSGVSLISDYLSVVFNNDFRGVPLALCQSCHPLELLPRQNTDAALGLSNVIVNASCFGATSGKKDRNLMFIGLMFRHFEDITADE